MVKVPAFEIWRAEVGAIKMGHTGDFFLCHRASVASHVIGLGERFRSKTRPYAYWTHCGVFVNSTGHIVEALTKGVAEDSISAYQYIPYTIVHLDLSDEDKANIVQYVKSTIGNKYNWLEIVASSINMATGSSVSLGVDGHQICSGLVANTLVRAGAILDMSSDHVTPADLGRYFNVQR